MKSLFLPLVLALSMLLCGSPVAAQQTASCNDVILHSDTFYVMQSQARIYDTMEYIGQVTTDYAVTSFEFPDSTYLKITETGATHGVTGPYLFLNALGYSLQFQQPNIPANTVVQAFYKVSHYNFGAPDYACRKPVTFIINPAAPTLGLAQINSAAVMVYPQPLRAAGRIRGGASLLTGYVLRDLQGRVLGERQGAPVAELPLERGNLPAGVYQLTVIDANGRLQNRSILVADN